MPGLRIGMKPTPSRRASGVPKRNPRASAAATASIPRPCEVLGEPVDGRLERPGVGQQRRDVLEQDAGLGEIRDVADVVAEVDRSVRGHSGRAPSLDPGRGGAGRRAPGPVIPEPDSHPGRGSADPGPPPRVPAIDPADGEIAAGLGAMLVVPAAARLGVEPEARRPERGLAGRPSGPLGLEDSARRSGRSHRSRSQASSPSSSKTRRNGGKRHHPAAGAAAFAGLDDGQRVGHASRLDRVRARSAPSGPR